MAAGTRDGSGVRCSDLFAYWIHGEDASTPPRAHLNRVIVVCELPKFLASPPSLDRLTISLSDMLRPTHDDLESVLAPEPVAMISHPTGDGSRALCHQLLSRGLRFQRFNHREEAHKIAIPMG